MALQHRLDVVVDVLPAGVVVAAAAAVIDAAELGYLGQFALHHHEIGIEHDAGFVALDLAQEGVVLFGFFQRWRLRGSSR